MSFPRTFALTVWLAAQTGWAASPPPWQGWGALIGEPELDAAIASALHQSAAVSASRASSRVRALETRLARAARHPRIDLGTALRTGREKNASTGFEEGDVARWEVGGTARLDLDVFGALRARTRGIHQAEQLAAFELRDHEVAWAAAMTHLLARVRYQQHKQETSQAMVETQQASRDWARSRADAGLLSASELDAYESRLLQAGQEDLSASEELAVSVAQWAYLSGEADLPAAPGAPRSPPPIPQPEELHTRVMNRPDVLAARATWLGADDHATAARRSRLPSLSAVAKAAGEGPSPVEDPDEWTAWAGLQLELPLWAPDKKTGALRAQEQVLVEEALYQDAIHAALNELQQAYARQAHAHRAWTLVTEEAGQFEKRLATAQRKFDQGLIMQTELESARTQWLAATDRAERARTLFLTHHIDLIQAGGGPGGGGEDLVTR